MRNRPILTTDDAKRMLAAAEACAIQRQLPVCIAVADEAGEPLALIRLEGVRSQTAELAIRKARCAATSHRSTAYWAERISDNPSFVAFPDMCALAGGVPIIHEGFCLGAIGVSGAKGHGEDDLVATAGIAALQIQGNLVIEAEREVLLVNISATSFPIDPVDLLAQTAPLSTRVIFFRTGQVFTNLDFRMPARVASGGLG